MRKNKLFNLLALLVHCQRGDEVIVSNMDWPFPGFRNQAHQLPATLSVIPLK